jgi:hypothetical protein
MLSNEDRFLHWLQGEPMQIGRKHTIHSEQIISPTYNEFFEKIIPSCTEEHVPFVSANMAKDDKYMSIFMYRQLVLSYTARKTVSHIEISTEYAENVKFISQNIKLIKNETGEKYRIYIDGDFNWGAFENTIKKMCGDCKKMHHLKDSDVVRRLLHAQMQVNASMH